MTAVRRRRANGGQWLPWAFLLAALFHVAPAAAQLSGSAAVVSDYRYRGETLSDDKPAAQLTVAYDDPSGWYGGIFGSNVQLFGESSSSLQGVPFVGYTHRLASGWSWEAGADYSAFAHNSDYNYAQAYVGAAVDNLSGRIYYAPDYFGRSSNILYAEVNATQRIFERVDLSGHVGVLRPISGAGNQDQFQFDVRLGVGIELYGFALRLAWVGTNTTSTIYPVPYGTRRNTGVVTIAKSF